MILFSNFNLSQGLNLGCSLYLNKDGECREALNCDFTEVGALMRLLGYAKYGSALAASNILGLYDFKSISGGITKWLAVNGTVLYYDNAGTWTSTLTGLTTGKEASFCTHLDTCIMSNGTDVMKKSTNGTTWASLGGTPPVAKYIVTFDNKVYALNLSGYTSRMRWTDDGTIETWTATNIQDVATNIGVGDEITGGTVNNNSLLVLKNYSVWGWDSYELRCLHATIGCRAPKSIATVDAWTFWLSHQGVYATNGGKPFRISKAIKPFIDGIADVTAPVGWAENNFYYLYIGDSNGVSKCLLIYDYDNNAWSYKSMNDVIHNAAILTTAAHVRSAYVGDDSGQIYKFNTGNDDDGVGIPFKWAGPPNMSGNPHLNKDYKYFYVFLDRTAKNGINVSYSLDFGDPQPLGLANKTVNEFAFPPGTQGHNIRIFYESNLKTDQQKIEGHVCLGEVLKGRLGDIE